MKTRKLKAYGIPMTEYHVEMYDQYFYLFFGDKNLNKMADAIQEEDNSGLRRGHKGMVFNIESKYEPNCIYVWFPNKDHEIVTNGTLAHECMHIIDYIAKNKGLKHDVNNQEVYNTRLQMNKVY